MCRLVFLLNKIPSEDFDNFKNLLLKEFEMTQGDGVGLVFPEKGIVKKYYDMSPIYFNERFLGHFRMSSVGERCLKNVHPFMVNNRYLVAHNGTEPVFKKFGDLLKISWGISVESDTDSEIIGLTLAPILEDPKRFESFPYKMFGNLMFYDKDENEFYLVVTNADMYFVKIRDDFIFYSTEIPDKFLEEYNGVGARYCEVPRGIYRMHEIPERIDDKSKIQLEDLDKMVSNNYYHYYYQNNNYYRYYGYVKPKKHKRKTVKKKDPYEPDQATIDTFWNELEKKIRREDQKW